MCIILVLQKRADGLHHHFNVRQCVRLYREETMVNFEIKSKCQYYLASAVRK